MTGLDIIAFITVSIVAGLMTTKLVVLSALYYKSKEKEQTFEKALQVIIIAASLFIGVGSYLTFVILRLLGKIL